MAINFRNYRQTTQIDTSGQTIVGVQIPLLTGVSNGTIVKTLEIISGESSSILHIIRKDAAENVYADIKVDLKANDYLVLWEGFFIIPYQHKLIISADSDDINVVANVIEMT